LVRTTLVCAVADLRDIPEVDRGAVHHLDRHAIHLVHVAGAAVELHLVILVPDLDGAGWKDEVLIAQGGRNIGGRELLGEQGVGIEIHHHGAEFPAKWKRDRGPLNGSQLRTDEVRAEVEQFLLGEAIALQT
jgi:hypothetical protein